MSAGKPGVREQWLALVDDVLPDEGRENVGLCVTALTLASFAHADGTIRAVNSERMAKRARQTKRTLERRRGELVQVELLRQTRRGHGRVAGKRPVTSEWALILRATTREEMAQALRAIRENDLARAEDDPSRHQDDPSRHESRPSRHDEREIAHPQSFGPPQGPKNALDDDNGVDPATVEVAAVCLPPDGSADSRVTPPPWVLADLNATDTVHDRPTAPLQPWETQRDPAA